MRLQIRQRTFHPSNISFPHLSENPPKWIRDYWPGGQKHFKSLPSSAIKKGTEHLRKDNLQATSEAADTAKAHVWQRELEPHQGYQKGSFSLNLPLISKVHIKLIIFTVFVLLSNMAEMGQVQKLLGKGGRRQTYAAQKNLR